MKNTPTKVGGYVEEGMDLSKSPSISVNTFSLNTKTTVPDESNKQSDVNSDSGEPSAATVSCCKHTESNDAENQCKDVFKPSEIISVDKISSNTSIPEEQTETILEDKEPSNCNKSSEKLDETISANQLDTIHADVRSSIEPDENSITDKTEPKDFLHLVNLDHQYLAASGMSNWKANTIAQQGQDNAYRETSTIVSPSYTMVKLYNKAEPLHGRLRQILTTREPKSAVLDNEIQTSIPNAALIQKHFQDMLTMTSLHSIEEPDEITTTEKENSVPGIENEEDSDDSDTETVSGAEDTGFITTDDDNDKSGDENIENKNITTPMRVGLSDSCGTISSDKTTCNVRQTSKSTSALCAPKVVERNMWSRVQRDIEDGLRKDAMLCHTFDKLLQRWAEYLQLSTEEVLDFEQEKTHEETAVEVIEMLEDKDRYVWQLLEEILNSRDPI